MADPGSLDGISCFLLICLALFLQDHFLGMALNQPTDNEH